MLTARKLLTLVFAFAMTTTGSMAADPGDPWTDVRLDPTMTSGAYFQTMTADLSPCCDGYYVKAKGQMLGRFWYNAQGQAKANFTIDTVIAVPNKVQGFHTLEDAIDADVRVEFMRKPDGQFAECMLVFQGFERGGPDEGAVARYGLEMTIKDGVVRPVQGVCDTNMHQKGIQVGVPELEFNDLLEAVSMADGNMTGYLKGYCE